jgi:sarcosine oxidase subunit alpha
MSDREETKTSATVAITVNGEAMMVPEGTTAAVAMMMRGAACRVSVSGEPRGPLCGMGVCMECCAIVDGVHHVRTCQLIARGGMEIITG